MGRSSLKLAASPLIHGSMDPSGAPRVSSAGYRLPERRSGTGPVTTGPPAEETRRAQGAAARAQQNPGVSDAVKQDRAWKELVWRERRGIREWEKNWGFLRDYDHMVRWVNVSLMGQLKLEEQQPGCVSLFSDHIPNTSNQAFGRRLTTPLGSELVRLDRLSLRSARHHKVKPDPEMLPC